MGRYSAGIEYDIRAYWHSVIDPFETETEYLGMIGSKMTVYAMFLAVKSVSYRNEFYIEIEVPAGQVEVSEHQGPQYVVLH